MTSIKWQIHLVGSICIEFEATNTTFLDVLYSLQMCKSNVVKCLLMNDKLDVVLCVPSGRPTSKWHGLMTLGLGEGECIFFLVYYKRFVHIRL